MRSVVRWVLRMARALAIAAGCFLAVTLALRQWTMLQPPKANSIHVTSATYGESCRGFVPALGYHNRVRSGNYSVAASQICDNTDVICPLFVDSYRIGDPAVGCAKNFTVAWRCGTDRTVHELDLTPEADEKIAWIGCQAQ
jgi:hypothetical protein